MKTTALIIATICVLTVPYTASAQSGDPAVDELIAANVDLWARGDAEGLARLYTEDAIRQSSGQTRVGRAAIQEEMAANFAGSFKGSMLSLTPNTLVELNDEVLVLEGTYELVGGDLPGKGRFVQTMVRDGDSLLMAVLSTTAPDE